MPHDSADEYEDDLAMRTQAEYMTHRLRSVFKVTRNDDLMEAAEKRQFVKKAARNARRYHGEHKTKVLVVEAIFIILTLGGFRIFHRTRRGKS